MRLWLESTPVSHRLTLLALMVGVILSGFYVLEYGPTVNNIEILHQDIRRIDQEIKSHGERAGSLLSIREEVQELNVSLEQITPFIPLETQEAELRQSVARMAKKYGLEMSYWLPEPPVQDSESRFVRLPYQIRVEGGYHEVAQFLNQTLLLPWAIGVSNVRMSKRVSHDQGNILQTEFRLLGVISTTQEKLSQLAKNQDRRMLDKAGS